MQEIVEMKKTLAISSIVLLVALLLSVMQVLAAPALDDQKPTNQPGAKATEKAVEKSTDEPGKGKGSEKENGKKVHLRGVISTVAGETLTLKLADGTSQAVKVSSSAKVKIPTLGKDASIADLKPEMQVNVQAEMKASGYEARMVQVIPGKPTKVHHVGVVTAYTAGTSLKVKDKDGVEVIFKLTADTKILPEERAGELKVGARVTVIFPRNLLGGEITAAGVVVHPAEVEK